MAGCPQEPKLGEEFSRGDSPTQQGCAARQRCRTGGSSFYESLDPKRIDGPLPWGERPMGVLGRRSEGLLHLSSGDRFLFQKSAIRSGNPPHLSGSALQYPIECFSRGAEATFVRASAQAIPPETLAFQPKSGV